MKLYIFKRRSYLGYSKVELERVVDVEQVIGGYRMVDGTYGFLDCQIDYVNSFDSECILLENDIGKAVDTFIEAEERKIRDLQKEIEMHKHNIDCLKLNLK